MGKCDSTNLTGRLLYTQLHNHNEILYNYYKLSISVSKFSHVIWSFLVLSCHSYFCLVHLASHNGKEPWNRQCLQHVATENIKCLFYLLLQAQQIYSTETLYLPGYTVRGAVLTLIKERHCIKLTVYKYFF